ncbi:uncharacterized protein LOC105847580 isoform X2 [Hydra vulgaris]|uniref:uncharacterized protein LOC105847580 isoform X2 n=1 Tax=Hydra vulgaris TaxID=6087 RepID=UPI001F5F5B92|nr:uncharacterized protein LOC105847580 isoform X2 [Hydra vulgaris]
MERLKKQILKIIVLSCWYSHVKGEIHYLIEPYGLPNCYLDLDLTSIGKFMTYNCNGINGDGVSFQSLADKTKYLRHYFFVLRLNTLSEVNNKIGDQQFYIHPSYYDSYVLLQSTNYPLKYLWRNNLQFNIDDYKDQVQSLSSFKLLVCDLTILKIEQITRYSINITIDVNTPIFNISDYYVIKSKDPNNDINLFDVTGSSALITSLHSYTIYEFSAGLQNEFGFYVYGNLFYFQTNKDDLNIISVESIDRYSVNVTINLFIPAWNISKMFVVKYTDPNNVTMLYNLTNGSAVIPSLQSYTVYQLSAGVRNEFGVYVFGNVVFYQTDQDIPTGCPSNLNVATISSTALLLSWDKVEFSSRKGIIVMYLYTCFSSEYSVSNNVGNNTFIVTVDNLVPETYYNCSVAACTKVGCGVAASKNVKTLVGNIHMDSCVHGFVEKDILNISLQLNGSGYNVTIEYFFPPFVTFASESVLHGFLKLNSAQFKYIFSGYFKTKGVTTHNITLKVNKRKCFSDFSIEIPVKLSYQNTLGVLKVVTMAYQKNLTCSFKVSPKIPRDKNASSEYYGRGMYIDNEKFNFYICMNQHVESTVPACYYSNIHNGNGLWAALDLRVGCVLGHHLVTKELWAIHRNQKSYLYFHGIHKKWLTLNNGDGIAASNFNKTMRISLEEDKDQVYTFGSNHWMGNTKGLFYRNDSFSSWLQKVRWNR